MSGTIRNPLSKLIWDDTPEYKKTRDKKGWYKAPKWFKKMNQKIDRAKAKDALRRGDDIERIRKHNDWDWN